MKNRIAIQILGVFVFITSGIAFSQTQVPNTFQAGQPARAADVNQNFSTLETAVNANTTAIGDNDVAIQANQDAVSSIAVIAIPRVKSNGQEIGTFLTVGGNPPGSENLFRTQFWALSDTGYVFRIAADDGSFGPAGELLRRLLWFETPDCSGQAYVAATRDPTAPLTAHFRSGAVFASQDLNDNPGVYYTSKGSAPNSVVLQSHTSSSAGVTFCNAQTEAVDAFLVFPNDPAITSVPSQRRFDPPITLGVQSLQVSAP